MQKTYTIAGKTYHQRPLVLGQIRQLSAELAGLSFDGNSPLDIVAALAGRLHRALAVVLIPEGVSLRDKQIDALAADLEFEIATGQAVEIVQDFFECTLTPELIELVQGALARIAGRMTGSSSSASSSLTETSPAETASSGE